LITFQFQLQSKQCSEEEMWLHSCINNAKDVIGAHTLSHLTVISYRSDFATACNRFLFTLPLPMLHLTLIPEFNSNESLFALYSLYSLKRYCKRKHLRRISI